MHQKNVIKYLIKSDQIISRQVKTIFLSSHCESIYHNHKVKLISNYLLIGFGYNSNIYLNTVLAISHIFSRNVSYCQA